MPKTSRCILVERAQVTVARKAAAAANPISSPGFMTMPAARTAARCASFGAGEAQDAGLRGFMGEAVQGKAIPCCSSRAHDRASLPGLPAGCAIMEQGRKVITNQTMLNERGPPF